MTNHRHSPRISTIVEWENTHNVNASRTREMLRILAEQVEGEINDHKETIELLIAVDPLDATESQIHEILGPHWADLADTVDIRIIPITNSSYYVLKNKAAIEAKGDIVVFVDCDVLPQPNWLHNILQPLTDPSIGVSQGTTYVEPDSLITKALALAWLFPLQRRDGSLSEENKTIANNIAFRRPVFLEYPYPDLNTWRGQCTAQRRQLDKDGIGVHWAGDARTAHPFPEGILATMQRAFFNGHDHVTRYEMEGGGSGDWKASYWRFRSLLKRAKTRRKKLKSDLDLSGPDEIVCATVAAFYWGCGFFSEAMVHLWPTFWRNRLKEIPRPPAHRELA